MGSRWQHCLVLICFTATHSNQLFLQGLMLPAPYYKKKGVPSDHRLFDSISCQAFIPFWKCVAMTPKQFPFNLSCNYRSMCITETERGKWKGGQFYSVEGHVLRVRKHMSHFFPMNPFSFVSKRAVSIGDWLLLVTYTVMTECQTMGD